MRSTIDSHKAQRAGTVSISERVKSAIPLTGMAVLTAAFFWRVLFGDQVLYWADLTLQFYPWRRFAAQSILRNGIPLWNPFVLCGSPFLANLQSAVFYPLNVLLLGLPVDRGMAWHVAIHVFLAGAFTFAFLRHLKVSRLAATVGALSFMLSAFVICRLTFLSMPSVTVWLPLCLLLADRLMWRPNALDAAGLSACLGVQFLGGHLQLSVMLVLAVAALVVARAVQRGGAAPRRAGWGFVWSLVALGIGTVVALPQLLPTADFVQHSSRASTSLEQATIYSLAPWQLTMFLVPDSFGHPAIGNYWGEGNYWELCPYFGVIGFALALTGMIACRRRARAFFALMFLGSLVLCLGKYTPVYEWLAYDCLPGFKSFKGPARFLFLSTFAGSVLAAFGTDVVMGSVGGLRRGWPLAAVSALSVLWLVCWVALRDVICQRGAPLLAAQFARIKATFPEDALATYAAGAHETVLQSLLMSTIILVAFGLVCAARARGMMRRPTAGLALVVLVAIDLAAFGLRANPTTHRQHYATRPAVLDHLASGASAPRVVQRTSVFEEGWGKYVDFMRFGSSDPQHIRGLVETLLPNINMWFDVPSIEGYDPIEQNALNVYAQRAQERLHGTGDTAMLDALDVRYLVTYEAEPHARNLRLVRTEPPLVYESVNCLSRAYSLPGEREWRERSDVWDAVAAARATEGMITIGRYEANRVRLRRVGDEPALLVLADTFDPGWRAAVDSKPAPVERVLEVIRGVRVPAGEHAVEFVYLPVSFRLGGFLGLVGLAALSALVASGLASRRRLP